MKKQIRFFQPNVLHFFELRYHGFICYTTDWMSSQATVPRRYRERGKSAGQPMRSHTLTSRSLPLIYINTSVIRVFCPTVLDKQTASGQSLARTHVPHMATLCCTTIGAYYVTQAAVWRLQVYLKVPVMVDKTERRHHISVHARLLKNI